MTNITRCPPWIRLISPSDIASRIIPKAPPLKPIHVVREKRSSSTDSSDSCDSTDSLDELISYKAAMLKEFPVSDHTSLGICFFIDRIQGQDEPEDGPFSSEVSVACTQNVPIVTAPNLLRNAIKKTAALFDHIHSCYNVYKHIKSRFIALIPKEVEPSYFKLIELIQIKFDSKDNLEATLFDTTKLASYQDFRSLFSEKMTPLKPNLSVYIGGHGSLKTKGTVCLLHSQYKDFVHLLDRIYHLKVCFASSCQPRGQEPTIQGVLVRRALPNLDARADSKKMNFAEFFKEGAEIDLVAPPIKLRRSLLTALEHMDIESPGSEPVIWNPTLKNSCGKPFKQKHRILLTYQNMRKLQIKLNGKKLEHLPIPERYTEIHLFSMKLPYGLIFKNEVPPVIYSHFGERGVHYIPYIKAINVISIESFVSLCFQHSTYKDGTGSESNGLHVFIIKHLKIQSGEYFNFILRLSPKEKPLYFYDKEWEPKRTMQETMVLFLNLIQDALPSKEVLQTSSAGQESVPIFLRELKSEIFHGAKENWIKYLERPKSMYIHLFLSKKIGKLSCQLILENCIDRNHLHLTGKTHGLVNKRGISESQASHTMKDLLLRFHPNKDFVRNLSNPEDFLAAVEKGEVRALKLYLALNPEALEIKMPRDPIVLAIESENVEVVRILLQYRSDLKPAIVKIIKYLHSCEGIISTQMQEIFNLFSYANCLPDSTLAFAANVGINKEIFLPYIVKCKKGNKKISLSFFEASALRKSPDLLILLYQNNLLHNLFKDLKNPRLRNSYEISLFKMAMKEKSKEKFDILCSCKIFNPLQKFKSALTHKRPKIIIFLLEMGVEFSLEDLEAIKALAKEINSKDLFRAIGLRSISQS